MTPFKPAVAFLFLIALSAATEIKEEKVEVVKPKEVVAPEEKPHEIKVEVIHEEPTVHVKPEEKEEVTITEVHEVPVHVEEHISETASEEPAAEPVVPEHQQPEPQTAENPAVTGRQFMPMYQPMFPQPSGFNNMIRRQFGGGMELLGDIVMMGMIGLPILGLLTVGSSSIANFLGFGSASSSKSSSKRNKRSLLQEKAAGAVEYAKDLWDVMEQLERAFEKYDLYQAECRLRAVCEAHHKAPRMGAWGQTILNLMRKQKELQSREILPVSRFLFSNYDDAARAGLRGDNCGQLYQECPHHLSYYVSDKDNEVENEVQIEMK